MVTAVGVSNGWQTQHFALGLPTSLVMMCAGFQACCHKDWFATGYRLRILMFAILTFG